MGGTIQFPLPCSVPGGWEEQSCADCKAIQVSRSSWASTKVPQPGGTQPPPGVAALCIKDRGGSGLAVRSVPGMGCLRTIIKSRTVPSPLWLTYPVLRPRAGAQADRAQGQGSRTPASVPLTLSLSPAEHKPYLGRVGFRAHLPKFAPLDE